MLITIRAVVRGRPATADSLTLNPSQLTEIKDRGEIQIAAAFPQDADIAGCLLRGRCCTGCGPRGPDRAPGAVAVDAVLAAALGPFVIENVEPPNCQPAHPLSRLLYVV